MPSPAAPPPARILAKVKELTKLESGVKYMVNRNPRNLERLRIAYKPTGYHLENPGRSFWHKYVVTFRHHQLYVREIHINILQTSSDNEFAGRNSANRSLPKWACPTSEHQ